MRARAGPGGPPGQPLGMVGTGGGSDRGLRAVVSVVGAVISGIGMLAVGAVGVGPAVVAVARGRVVVGASSVSTSVVGVVVDAEAGEPERDVDPELDDDEAMDGTGVTDRPESTGALSGGVSSGSVTLDMYRLKIWAGSDPPLTLATPWTLSSGLDWPSGYPIHTAVVSLRV